MQANLTQDNYISRYMTCNISNYGMFPKGWINLYYLCLSYLILVQARKIIFNLKEQS